MTRTKVSWNRYRSEAHRIARNPSSTYSVIGGISNTRSGFSCSITISNVGLQLGVLIGRQIAFRIDTRNHGISIKKNDAMIGMRCYCMLVLRELGKNQPLVIIVNIAGFLKFTGILDRDRSVIQFRQACHQCGFADGSRPNNQYDRCELATERLIDQRPPFAIMLSVQILDCRSSDTAIVLLLWNQTHAP